MEDNNKIDLNEIKKIISEKKKIIALIFILCVIIGVIYTVTLVKPMYRTTSKVLIDKSDSSIAELLPDTDVIKEVAQNLEIDYKKVKKSIATTYDKSTKIIEIYVNFEDKMQSYNIANQYIELLKLKLQDVYGIEKYEVIKNTEIAQEPYNINPIKDVILFSIIGIMIICVYVTILYSISGITNGRQIENLKIRFLGHLIGEDENENENKNKKNSKKHLKAKNKTIDVLKMIITNIELNEKARNPKKILVAGINSSDDSSYVTKKIALAYRELKNKILIINAKFDDTNKEYISFQDEKITVKTAKELNITQTNLITNEAIDILKELENEYDIIFVNSESILENENSIIWSNIVQGVVIVPEYRKTKEKDLLRAKKYIENVNGNIIGAVLNRYE